MLHLLPVAFRQREFPFVFKEERRSVKDMIEALGVPHTEVDLILVNGVSGGFDRLVADEDRISVYPVFEGMDITCVTLLRPRPLRSTRLLVEGFQHDLVRYLRAMGLDAVHEEKASAEDISRRCREEGKILVSSSPALLKHKQLDRAVLVPRGPLSKRLSCILGRMDLFESVEPFSRCIICNTRLVPSLQEEIEGKVPPKARRLNTVFMSCSSCGRVYWRGSHVSSMEGIIKGILGNR